MDKLGAYRAFVGVVDAAGFAAAGRRMGMSRSALNRLVAALEDDLGVQLLNRTTRSVAPTATGRALHARVRNLLDEIDTIERDIENAQSEPVGELRINAPMSFGTLHLAPAIADFMARYPELRIELALNDRAVDIVAEGFDLTVRIAAVREDVNLVDFRIAEARRVVCASPGFLKQHGPIAHPNDLKELPGLHYGDLNSRNRWHLTGPDGAHEVLVRGVLCSNNGEALCEAAVRGLGVALLPTFIVGRELQAGRLVSLLSAYRPPELTLCVVYPPSRHLSAKVRLFTDFLVERFGGDPYWDLVR